VDLLVAPGHEEERHAGQVAQRPIAIRRVRNRVREHRAHDHGRVAQARIHDDENPATAIGVLRRGVAGSADRGVTVEQVRTDNGSAHRSLAWRARVRSSDLPESYDEPPQRATTSLKAAAACSSSASSTYSSMACMTAGVPGPQTTIGAPRTTCTSTEASVK